MECPHGHVFKVKDKYAGKRGLCPHCPGQTVVKVPDGLSGIETNKAYRKAVIDENRATHAAPEVASSSVFDEPSAEKDAGTSGSLLGSSVIRHNIKCQCGKSVPMWYARCPGCGVYLQNR